MSSDSLDSFAQPRVALNRIYTRLGDEGFTSLAGGERRPKDDLRVEAYGDVDELNSALGCAQTTLADLAPRYSALSELSTIIARVQNELFNLGSVLSTLPEDLQPRQPRILPANVSRLETEIDRLNAELAPLRSFVLPGGSRLAAELHVCRTICRRAERAVVRLAGVEDVPREALLYLNRLSDAMFVWSRWSNHVVGTAEVLWDPNAALK